MTFLIALILIVAGALVLLDLLDRNACQTFDPRDPSFWD